MALTFPSDLDAWQRWQSGRRPIRNFARELIRPLRYPAQSSVPAFIARQGDRPAEIVAVLESRAASSRVAVLEPLRHLMDLGCVVVSPFDATNLLPTGWESIRVDDVSFHRMFPDLAVVISAAHYLPLGAAAWADAQRRGHQYVTVQHGLLTPFSAPLPIGAPVLTWSEVDAHFWLSGRGDLEATVVGSQLLWEAAGSLAPHVSRFARPTFLGQLHGAELPRRGMIRAASTFCRETGATYRPHPSETNRASQLQHRWWERQGIEIDRRRIALARTDQPVVSAFSTGVVEAAARGIPSWVFYPDAPAWLLDFWRRYRMSPWGKAPTPAPALSDREPAVAIADWVKGRL